MRHLGIICVLGLLVVNVGCESASNTGFRPLFNGEDLTGWKPVNTAPSTWLVKDGMLICSGKPIGELRTERMYQNFELEVEWRHLKPRGNAGIFIWADDITARGQPFHRGIEIQVLENAYGQGRGHTTHGDIFPIHGAVMFPVNGRGGSRSFPTENRSNPSPEWNHYRIRAVDGAVSLAVNGKMVTAGMFCSPSKGYICLESEGGIVEWRNIRIKELPDTPVDDADVAIADRGYRCLYNGVDLWGWMSVDPGWQANNWVLAYKGDGGNDSVLESDGRYQDFGFIFDVRLNDKSGTTRLYPRGKGPQGGGEIIITPTDPVLIEGAKGRMKWNRFEGRIVDNKLTLSINGEVVVEDLYYPWNDAGPMQIFPGGPVDFANIYVRDLAE
ncbi:MAG: 3-keto-disaccharide hydrolase [Planctomycetota bacterium]|jgi:hypothetical protein